MNGKNTQEFIEKAKEIHGDKYDYSKVEYVNAKTKVCIICPTHGEFWQIPYDHIKGHGCNKCPKKKKYNTTTFIEKARQIHGDKYDYSKVDYKGIFNKICVVCPIHGEFFVKANDHINNKSGCPKCCKRNKKYTLEEFVEKAKEIHGDKYDYSKVNYIDNKTKICIICPIHGEFWQKPVYHLSNNCDCPKCKQRNKKYSTQEFIEKAKEIHGDKYDYSKVEYVGCNTKICIICPIHGEFYQTPVSHLSGQGCPICNESHLEKEIKKILDENKIQYIQQYKTQWLGKQSLDFYIPSKNIAIECQGLQHFKPVEHFGGEKEYLNIIKRDNKKKILCNKKNIDIIYYSDFNYNFPYKVYKTKEEILDKIKE